VRGEKERDQSRRLGWMSQARTPENGGGEGEGGGAGEKPLAKKIEQRGQSKYRRKGTEFEFELERRDLLVKMVEDQLEKKGRKR
jgi:hypothetical protein